MNVTSPNKLLTVQGLKWAAEAAAEKVGVRLYNLRESGKGIAFTLKTGQKDEYREDWRGNLKWQARYQRLSQRENVSTAKGTEGVTYNSVVPGAVCWHGHAAFMRAFYALVPDAKIKTAMATYLNREHFESTHKATYCHGGDRMGVKMLPYGDACTCEDS